MITSYLMETELVNPYWHCEGETIYCGMTLERRLSTWFNPRIHLVLSILLSLLTAVIAFRSVEMEAETMRTFQFFYIILFAITLVFIFQSRLTDVRTRQLLQFSFFLLGSVLMLTAVIAMLGRSPNMAAVFILILFLPGLAIFRAGLHFKKAKHVTE